MKLGFTFALAFFLVACSNATDDKPDEKATKGSKVIEQPKIAAMNAELGLFRTKLAYGWRRVKLVNSDRVKMTEAGIELTARGPEPTISFDRAFVVDADMKYEVQVDYEVYDDLDGVIPVITSWIFGKDGQLLEEKYKIKFFRDFTQSGTLSANFHMPSAENVALYSIALPAETASVVFTTNPTRGRDGTRGIITRFDVSASK